MTKRDPKLRKALNTLSSDLEQAGYAPDECEAIVDGAAESVTAFLDANPDASTEEALAVIDSFGSPQLAPEFEPDRPLDQTLARYAWIALAVVVLGMTVLAPLSALAGGDGGTIMVLCAMIALPVACILSFLARRSKMGRMAGYTTLGTAIAVMGLFLAFA